MGENLNEFYSGLQKLKVDLEYNLTLIEKREAELDLEEKSFKERVHDQFITFYIEGELFRVSASNILKFKSSLLYSAIIKLPEKVIKEGIYIDRNPKNFEQILNFLKHSKVDLSELNAQLINEVREEAKFYELDEMVAYIDNVFVPPQIINYVSNGPFIYSYNALGDFDVESIKTMNSKSGITITSPAKITFELNRAVEISGIFAIGFMGSTMFSSANGIGSIISTSIDNKHFTQVGTLNAFDTNITLKKSRAKFLQFESVSYIGFSYLEIIR